MHCADLKMSYIPNNKKLENHERFLTKFKIGFLKLAEINDFPKLLKFVS